MYRNINKPITKVAHPIKKYDSVRNFRIIKLHAPSRPIAVRGNYILKVNV
jgi:hypothetical protein